MNKYHNDCVPLPSHHIFHLLTLAHSTSSTKTAKWLIAWQATTDQTDGLRKISSHGTLPVQKLKGLKMAETGWCAECVCECIVNYSAKKLKWAEGKFNVGSRNLPFTGLFGIPQVSNLFHQCKWTIDLPIQSKHQWNWLLGLIWFWDSVHVCDSFSASLSTLLSYCLIGLDQIPSLPHHGLLLLPRFQTSGSPVLGR